MISNGPKELAGMRILIVEDQYLIADDVRRTLSAEGAEIVGPAPGLLQALELIRERALDVAVLDINLDGESVFPAAEELDRLGVPYIFLSGYEDWVLPDIYQRHTRIEKPLDPQALLEAVKRAR